MLIIFCIFIAFNHVKSQSYTVGLNNPFLLDNSYAKIKTIFFQYTYQYFLVGFSNGQARRYTSTFSSYTNISLPEPVDKFDYFRFQFTAAPNLTLSNGTAFTMITDYTASISNNLTTVRNYMYPSFMALNTFSLNEKILYTRGGLFNISAQNHVYNLMVCSKSIKLQYKNNINTILDYESTYGVGTTALSADHSQFLSSFSFDTLVISIAFYVSLSNRQTYYMNTTLTFLFNFTSSSFDYASFLLSTTLVFSSLTDTVTTVFANSLYVMMQSNSTGNYYYFSVQAKTTGTVSAAIPKDQMLKFFLRYGKYYLLQTRGLLQINFPNTTYVGLVSLVATLPFDAYSLTTGANMDAFYIPLGSYIYKASKCMNQSVITGQNIFNPGGTGCASYNCSAANCSSCPFNTSACGICISNFTRSWNYTCQNLTSVPPAINQTDATNPANNTNVSNMSNTNTSNTTFNSSTINDTGNQSSSLNITNSINSINSTSNNTVPIQNFNSISPNTSSFPSSPNNSQIFQNSTMNGLIMSYSLFNDFWLSFWLDLLNVLLQLIKQLISIPAARSLITPIFYYFGNFDDLFFYQFHDRIYGDTMNQLFEQISEIQGKKWSLFNYQTMLNLISADSQTFNSFVSYQSEYLSYPYSSNNHTKLGPEDLISNCTNFFITAAPITIIIFILLNRLFRILFNYPVSKYLRRYSLWPLMAVILFDGNVQQFTFYMVSEWQRIFAFRLSHKILKSFIIWCGFVLIVFSSSIYLLTYAFYKKLNKLLMDNNKNTINGQIMLIIQTGLRSVFLGALHFLLRVFSYELMIVVLLVVEMSFTISFTITISCKIFKEKSKTWVFLIMSFLRFALLFTLIFDYSHSDQPLIEISQFFLIFSMIALFCLAICKEVIATIIEFGNKISEIFCSGRVLLNEKENQLSAKKPSKTLNKFNVQNKESFKDTDKRNRLIIISENQKAMRTVNQFQHRNIRSCEPEKQFLQSSIKDLKRIKVRVKKIIFQ